MFRKSLKGITKAKDVHAVKGVTVNINTVKT